MLTRGPGWRSGRWPVAAALAALLLVLATTVVHAQSTLITIATAGKQGIYYPTGGAICRLVNDGRFEHGIRCVVETSPGSIANLRGLRTGQYDLALAQSDWLYHAYRGTGVFADNGPDHSLRSVLSLHSEAFTVVARRESGIRTFRELKGKRVNVGPTGSGNRATADVVLEAVGLSEADLDVATELPPDEQAAALCRGIVDAAIYLVGHPNRSIDKMAKACGAVIVPVEAVVIERLVKKFPYYRPLAIPGDLYPGNPQAVPTFGLTATLVTTVRTDARIIDQIVRSVFGNLDAFRKMHPALATLDPDRMIGDVSLAPLHSGVILYLRSTSSPAGQ